MDEEKEIKTLEEKPAVADSTEGDKPKTTTIVDDANAAAERLEAANKRTAELLRQREEIEAQTRLGGTAEAGQPPAEKKEETPSEYKDRVMKET